MKSKFFILLFTVFSLSCWGGFDVEEHLFNKYYLTAADDINQLELSYHEDENSSIYETIISSVVFAVGYNNTYIIAKQHPATFPDPPNKAITNYFILPVRQEMNWATKNGLLGPLTLDQFNQKRKQLNIPGSLTFTKVIKELE